jgi:hypothetical protein
MATNFSTSVISDGMIYPSCISSLRWMQSRVFICFGASCDSCGNQHTIATFIFNLSPYYGQANLDIEVL